MDDEKPAEADEHSDADVPWNLRTTPLQVLTEILVPAAVVLGLWITGNLREEYHLSTVFVLALVSFSVTWLAGRRFKTPFPPDRLALFVPALACMAFLGHTAIAWRFPELELSIAGTSTALLFAAVLADEVRSTEGFADSAIMMALGYAVPLMAFELGYPRASWAVFVLSVLVIVPIGVLVFNKGVDTDVNAMTLAPLFAFSVTDIFGTAKPSFDPETTAAVVMILVLFRLVLDPRGGRAGWEKASRLILHFNLGFIFMGGERFRELLESLKFW